MTGEELIKTMARAIDTLTAVSKLQQEALQDTVKAMKQIDFRLKEIESQREVIDGLHQVATTVEKMVAREDSLPTERLERLEKTVEGVLEVLELVGLRLRKLEGRAPHEVPHER